VSPELTNSDNPQKKSAPFRDFPPSVAFNQLAQFLQSAAVEPQPPTSKAKGKSKQTEARKIVPVVVLAFDEVHTTTQRHRTKTADPEWSFFEELCEALRRLQNLPLFSLFLSTSSKISQFVSASEGDLNSRIIEGRLNVVQPYTDIGFDALARVISLDGSWNLEQLTDIAHITHQGRPLYAFIFCYS
jgi:hypothetical protein